MKTMHHRIRGLSIVETMLTVGVISLVAALTISPYRDYQIRNKVEVAIQAASTGQNLVEQTCVADDRANLGDVDFHFSPTDFIWEMIIGGTCEQGYVEIKLQSDSDNQLVLDLVGVFNPATQTMHWTCTRFRGSQDQVPEYCREPSPFLW